MKKAAFSKAGVACGRERRRRQTERMTLIISRRLLRLVHPVRTFSAKIVLARPRRVPRRDRKEAKGIWPTGDDAGDLVKVAEKCKSQTVSMTKADLITVIADKLKFPRARAELLVDVVFRCLEQSMGRGEKIEIRGFGNFTVRQYRAYDGRNPRTGATVKVKPKRLAFFKVGKEMRERVNGGRRSTQVAAAAEPDKVA